MKDTPSFWLAVVLLLPTLALAADPTPPGPPNDAASAMYTTDDLYNRLHAGSTGTKRGETFSEPATGPAAGVVKSLDAIMAVAPSADNVNGATADQVLSSKTFWGLRTDGTWGTTTGTLAVGSDVTGNNGELTFSIPDGYYAGKSATASDPNLVSANIRCGTTIFGIVGTEGLPVCVAKTGQTTSYGAGDDGALQKGCTPSVTPSGGNNFGNYKRTSLSLSCTAEGFINNGDGTVTDNLTGLIWLKNANCFGITGWAAALTAANTLASGSCGLSDGSVAGDWRLPNINELRSLLDPALASPYLPAGHPFSGVQSYYYWSSTTFANNTTGAWGVGFSNGYVSSSGKTGVSYVWPVRGGQE